MVKCCQVARDAGFKILPVCGTRNALEAGYRHLDCAPIYGNESLVGEAIKPWLQEHGRDSVFLTSKVWNDAHRPELLRCVRMGALTACCFAPSA